MLRLAAGCVLCVVSVMSAVLLASAAFGGTWRSAVSVDGGEGDADVAAAVALLAAPLACALVGCALMRRTASGEAGRQAVEQAVPRNEAGAQEVAEHETASAI